MLTGQSVPKKSSTTAFLPFHSPLVCFLPWASTRAKSVTAEGPAAEIMDKLQRVEGVNLVEPRDASGQRVTIELRAERGHDVRPEAARAVVESGWKLFEIKTSGLSLEEIFLELTTRDFGEAN